MSGFGGTIADVARLGFLPGRHHDPTYLVNRRTMLYMGYVERNTLSDPLQRLRPELEDPELKLGDVQCLFVWQKEDRECSVGLFGPAPSVISTPSTKPQQQGAGGGSTMTGGAPQAGGATGGSNGQVLPLEFVDQAYRRVKQRPEATPPWASRFPGGWTGLASVAFHEDAEIPTWHPDSLGVVAPSFGNPDHGTRVFDTTAAGQVDKERWAYLQQLACVVDFGKPGQAPCDFEGKALALQLGGDKLETKAGYALFVDHDNGWLGSAAAKHGGPLTLGPCGLHTLGKDADGNEIKPVHLDREALWLYPGVGDGPLHFERSKWQEVNPDGPHWLRAHLRWNDNPEDHFGASFCGKNYTGAFGWQVGTHIYVPEPPPEGDRFPEPQPPPPGGEKPETPGNGAIGFVAGGGERELIGGNGAGLTQQDIVNAVNSSTPGAAEVNLSGFIADAVNASTPVGYVPGADGPETPLVGNAGSFRPAYPHVSGCLALPGIALKASATATGAWDVQGASVLSPEARAAFEDAPMVAQLTGYAASPDGEWGSWSDATPNEGAAHPTGKGAAILLPSGVSVADIANDVLTNTRTGYLVLPHTLGTGGMKLALAQPDFETGGVKSGVVFTADASGATIDVVDSTGAVTSSTPIGGGGSSGDGNVFTSSTTGATSQRLESTDIFDEAVDGGAITIYDLIVVNGGDTGVTIVDVLATVLADFNGSGVTASDTIFVGTPASSNRWGTTGVGGYVAGSENTYTTDPRQWIAPGGSLTIRLSASAFTFNGSTGKIRVSVIYEQSTHPVS